MLDFETARARVLAWGESAGRAAGVEMVPLVEAQGRVLVEDVVAPAPFPLRDVSAMDGYAVRSRDFVETRSADRDADVSDADATLGDASLDDGARWEFEVIGESRTGHAAPSLDRRAAVRIFTGAIVPSGADAVVMQENTTRHGERVVIEKAPREFENVRRRGEDLAEGTVVLRRGTRLGPFQLGLLAMVDRAEVLVGRAPRVAILCTGDELGPAGAPRRPEQLPESNGIALEALARNAGAKVTRLPIVVDELERVEDAIRSAVSDVDLLLTVGGVSVGDHDVVKPALERLGAETEFWKVSIKPGKPLLLARSGKTIVLGLPGNPASAQITFALFGMPLLRAFQGDGAPTSLPRRARLTQEVRQKPGRTTFLRATLDGDRVTPLDNQSSGAGTALAWANAFAVVPSDASVLEAGALVEVISFLEL